MAPGLLRKNSTTVESFNPNLANHICGTIQNVVSLIQMGAGPSCSDYRKSTVEHWKGNLFVPRVEPKNL